MDISSKPKVSRLIISEILNDFKTQSKASNPKDLVKTVDDGDYVKNIIAEYEFFKNKTKALKNSSSVEMYKKLYYRKIKYSIIQQGFISKSSLKKFNFNTQELIERIKYRNFIKDFIIENVTGDKNDVILARLMAEAKKGKKIETTQLSDEYSELFSELKQLVGSGELTDNEESEGWLRLKDIQTRDIDVIYKEKAKDENLCCFILDYFPNLTLINKERLLSLSTSNLETILSIICKALNDHNIIEINAKSMADKKKRAKEKYIPKKALTASQKKALIKKYKLQGKNQEDTAKLLGCCVRTVRNYWT